MSVAIHPIFSRWVPGQSIKHQKSRRRIICGFFELSWWLLFECVFAVYDLHILYVQFVIGDLVILSQHLFG